MVDGKVKEVLKDQDTVVAYTKAMQEFNQKFCDAMASCVDFTIKLEVHGNVGELIHVKVDSNSWRRPRSAERKRQKKVG